MFLIDLHQDSVWIFPKNIPVKEAGRVNLIIQRGELNPREELTKVTQQVSGRVGPWAKTLTLTYW